MSDDQIREFLVRWVMEVGSGKVTWDTQNHGYTNSWYGTGVVSVNHPDLAKFFDFSRQLDNIAINQKGLDFIAGGRDDQERIPG